MVSVMALRWELETKGQANGKKKNSKKRWDQYGGQESDHNVGHFKQGEEFGFDSKCDAKSLEGLEHGTDI